MESSGERREDNFEIRAKKLQEWIRNDTVRALSPLFPFVCVYIKIRSRTSARPPTLRVGIWIKEGSLLSERDAFMELTHVTTNTRTRRLVESIAPTGSIIARYIYNTRTYIGFVNVIRIVIYDWSASLSSFLERVERKLKEKIIFL